MEGRIQSRGMSSIFALGWATYTPSFEPVTTPINIIYARYIKIRRLVVVQVLLQVTGLSPAVPNPIGLTIPTFLPIVGAPIDSKSLGVATYFDNSSNTRWGLSAEVHASTTQLVFTYSNATSGDNQLGDASGPFSSKPDTGDELTMSVMYETNH